MPVITPYTGFSQNKLASNGFAYTYRGERIVNIDITPAQYSMENQIAVIYKKLVFKISFEDEPESEFDDLTPLNYQVNFNNFPHLNRLCFQYHYPDTEFTTPQAEDRSQDYLIITIPEYEEAVEAFVEWKKQEGYHCHIIADTGWTSPIIKETVIDFARQHPDFNALLLVGDTDVLPSNQIIDYSLPLPRYYSDLDYACLDHAGDYFPDVVYGRIPAKSVEEVNDVFTKIIQYETCAKKSVNGGFIPNVTQGVHIAPFKGTVTRETCRYVLTNEHVLLSLQDLGLTHTRVYFAAASANPQEYYDQSKMPDYLKRPAFAWDGTTSDIISAINKSPGYVLYRGHGDWNKWISPQLMISDCQTFTNKRWQPLVFSIACTTGQMNVDSFAKRLLAYSSTNGASGVLAASNVSYTWPNDELAEGVFQCLYPDSNILPSIAKPDKWCTVGDAIQFGLAYMMTKYTDKMNWVEHQYQVYHWFGDPTMRMFTKRPEFINNVGISYVLPYTNVYTQDEDVQVTCVYNSGKIISLRGSHTQFPSIGSEYIVITGLNKVPKKIYLSEGDDNQRSEVGSCLKSAFFANGELRLNYHLSKNDVPLGMQVISAAGTATVVSSTGAVMGSYSCPIGQSTVTIDCSAYPTGIYTVSFNLYGKNFGSATIVKR